jgi:hypothetical protein
MAGEKGAARRPERCDYNKWTVPQSAVMAVSPLSRLSRAVPPGTPHRRRALRA